MNEDTSYGHHSSGNPSFINEWMNEDKNKGKDATMMVLKKDTKVKLISEESKRNNPEEEEPSGMM